MNYKIFFAIILGFLAGGIFYYFNTDRYRLQPSDTEDAGTDHPAPPQETPKRVHEAPTPIRKFMRKAKVAH